MHSSLGDSGSCPPEARNQFIANFLRWAAAGFRVLPCYATDTNYWRASTPDKDQREREDQPNLRRDIFLWLPLVRSSIERRFGTHMRASVEALCAVPCMEEERFAALDLGELVPQPLNLPVPP